MSEKSSEKKQSRHLPWAGPLIWLKERIQERPLLALLHRALVDFQEDRASRLAAALAYYTAFSLAPLLLIVVGVAGMAFGRDVALGFLLDEIQRLVGREGAELIRTILQEGNQEQRSLISAVVGAVTLLIGATGVFNHLHEALNVIWEVPQEQRRKGLLGAVVTRLWSFGMVLSVGFLLMVSLVLSAALAALDEFVRGLAPSLQVLLQGANLAGSFVLVCLLFAALYKILPDIDVAWRDVWVGAVFTGVLFSIGKFGIGLYLGNSSISSAYGAAGSFVVLLVWIYYSAQIFFFGAELTQAYANRQRHKTREGGARPGLKPSSPPSHSPMGWTAAGPSDASGIRLDL
ncbi:YihY/virulence factor BrkB family protein [Litorilinea aerophila]|uniref:YihY/virulence factor BrkB family protein n=1 Tax=Litorilinea aerophila TaxID=1204385 RepID=UPI001B87ADD7|nr:YihY/virulence factor BrkB family protein [Litorilinea aerophila]MCC9078934.1 YihY/virulence factor BrkB family protein [Litorilinea aerophila]